ncbi:MAG: S26 family signal peptidase [Pseudomonadota bacterium]
MTRFGYAVATCLSMMGVGATSLVPVPLKLVWNASASAPIGLYAIEPAGPFEITDLLAIVPPAVLANFMVERGYVGRDVPLVKRVAALSGQEICRSGHAITVDGVVYGDALERDRMGRLLPAWRGCRRVAEGELFLMNFDVQDSFDGRYFGPLPASSVIGRAMPLYTDEAGDGHFVWRAPTR